YRPNIDIKYTIPSEEIVIETNSICTVSKDAKDETSLSCGFDTNNDKIYGLMCFDLSTLPDPNKTVITDSYIEIRNKNTTKSKQDIRYNVEFVDIENITYTNIQNRDRIEFIGYEVSRADLQKNKTHKFIFDNFSRLNLEQMHKDEKNATFLIKPTSAISKNHLITWHANDDKHHVKLVVKYIHKRKFALPSVEDVKLSTENGKVKLTWDNPEDDDFVGTYVVRNRHHAPKNYLDGDKIYAGPDCYSYDDFGNTNISKYYGIFSYDDIPNYSEPVIIKHKGKD
ncbi:MAG: peptidase, partial [Campylobacterota bacterium]|nr:peptidase [Campylobacterota bacterium]